MPIIEVPEWLCADAKAEWARVAESAVGADTTTLAAYCQSYGRWREAERFLEENGTVLVVRDDKGVVKSIGKAPQVAVSQASLDRMVKLGKALGIGCAAKHTERPAPVVQEEWSGEIWPGELSDLPI